MHDDNLLAGFLASLRSALSEWRLPPTSRLSLLSFSENATFLAETDTQRVVLRVHRPGYHDAAEIQSELAWIAAVRSEAVVVTPEPVVRRDGALIGTVEFGAGPRHVTAFAFMPGEEPRASDDLTGWLAELGRISARLHGHSRNWQRPAGFTRKRWDFDTTLGHRPHWGDWRAGLGLEQSGRALLTRTVAVIERRLAEYGEAAERFGLIHADLRLANLLAERDRLGVIDFDDCGFSWFMYDFAAAISFHEHEPFIPALQASWIAGYREVAPLTPADEAMLPVFVMLRRILLTAWVASHAETPTAVACGPAYTEGTLALAAGFLDEQG